MITIGIALFIVLCIIWLMIDYSWRIKNQTVLYQIDKGSHYSHRPLNDWFKQIFKLSLVTRGQLTFNVMFGDGCDWEGDTSIHKLYGISFGFFPHSNSIRIGWSPNHLDDEVFLFSYAYVNGIRKEQFISSVNKYEEYRIKLFRDLNGDINMYLYEGGETKWEFLAGVCVGNIKKHIFMWKLWPYYGGQLEASKTVKIYITETI